MESLRSLFITLGLKADEAAFATAQASVNLLQKAGEKLVEAFKFVGDQIIESVTATAEYADGLDDASKRTGIAADDLQKLGFAAAQSGSSFEGVQGSLAKLSINIGKAGEGSAEAMQGFSALGIGVRKSNGDLKSSNEILFEAADKLQGITNETEKASKAEGIFGKQWQSVMPMIADGSDGLNTLMQQAEDLGLVMDNETVSSLAEFNDMLSAGAAVLKSFQREIGTGLIKVLKPLVSQLLNWVAANRQLISQRLEQVADILGRAFMMLYRVVDSLLSVVLWLVDGWKVFSEAVGSVTSGIIAFAAIAGIAIFALGAPVFLLIGLFGILFLAIEDIWVSLNGGKSLIDVIGPKFTKFIDDWTKSDSEWWVIDRLKAAIELLTHLSDLIPVAGQSWADAFKNFRNSSVGQGVFGAPTQSIQAPTPAGDAPLTTGAAGGNTVAPRMNANFVIQGAANPQEVATQVETHLDDWWNRKTAPLVNSAAGGQVSGR